MSVPRISVVMPVFNAASHIGEAIQSILAQTFRDFELIIVDDGSTDGSAQIAQEVRDERVRFFQNGKNMGAGGARNKALEKTDGEFIAFLDADDVALPSRLETQLAFLGTHAEIGLIATTANMIAGNGEISIPMARGENDPARIRAKLLFENPIIQSSVMVRRASLGGVVFRSGYEPAEDYDLWTRLPESVRMAILDEPLVRYRQHPGGVSSRDEAGMRESVRKIMREQLERLHLSPSDEELEIHVGLRSGLVPREGLTAQTRVWLDKVCNANSRYGIYDAVALSEIINELWEDFSNAAERIRRGRAPWRRMARGLRDGMKRMLLSKQGDGPNP